MKSLFYTAVLAGGFSLGGHAQSLYNLTSPLGHDDALPLSFRTTLQFGYDDNVNAVPKSSVWHQDAAYARFSVGAEASNWDARTQYSFDIRVGGIFYLESMKFGTHDVMSDITLKGALVHNIDSTLRYTASAGVSYMPEPDYSSGITIGSRAGEYFYGYFDNSISKAWSNRFSTITGFNVATLQYSDSFSKIDNRDYYRLNQAFRWKYSMRGAAVLRWNGEYADRRFGADARSHFVIGAWEYALTQYTNISLQAGPQFKHTSISGNNTYLYASANLEHKLTDRHSINVFFRREDESTNTYQNSRNYGSNATYRVGVQGAYKINHVFTLKAGGNLIDSAYRKGQEGLNNRDANTFNIWGGLTYQASRDLAFTLSYSYTHSKNDTFLTNSYKYHRNVYALSANYTF